MKETLQKDDFYKIINYAIKAPSGILNHGFLLFMKTVLLSHQTLKGHFLL